MKRNTKTSEERERRIMLSNTSNLIKELDELKKIVNTIHLIGKSLDLEELVKLKDLCDELTKKTFIFYQTQQKTIELIDSYYKQYIKTNL